MKNLSNAKIFHSCHYKNKDTTKKNFIPNRKPISTKNYIKI